MKGFGMKNHQLEGQNISLFEAVDGFANEFVLQNARLAIDEACGCTADKIKKAPRGFPAVCSSSMNLRTSPRAGDPGQRQGVASQALCIFSPCKGLATRPAVRQFNHFLHIRRTAP